MRNHVQRRSYMDRRRSSFFCVRIFAKAEGRAASFSRAIAASAHLISAGQSTRRSSPAAAATAARIVSSRSVSATRACVSANGGRLSMPREYSTSGVSATCLDQFDSLTDCPVTVNCDWGGRTARSGGAGSSDEPSTGYAAVDRLRCQPKYMSPLLQRQSVFSSCLSRYSMWPAVLRN